MKAIATRGITLRMSCYPVSAAALLMASLALGGCAGHYQYQGTDTRAVDLFRADWVGNPVAVALEAWGEPSAWGGGGDVWIWYHPKGADFLSSGVCARSLRISSGIIVDADLEQACPPADALGGLGWLRPLDLRSIRVTYDRFHQTYRASTEPEKLAVGEGEIVEARLVAGFHRDLPESVEVVLLLRAAEAGGGGAVRALAIPPDLEITAEARVLLNGDFAFPAPAIGETPLPGMGGGDETLVVVLTRRIGALRVVRSFEALLPSGAEVELSKAHVDTIRELVALASRPDEMRAAASN